MTTVTTRNNYRNDFTKNHARVYNADTRKTLGQKLKDYWHETMEFYGKLYEANGYRPINFIGF